MSKEPMTQRGFNQLLKELEILKKETRPAIINAIAEAREHGDLKENAEYHSAKEQHEFCTARIEQISQILASAQVIDVTEIPHTGRVIFGSTVTAIAINADNSDTEVKYQIVGDYEADVKKNRISYKSPVAKCLIGKSEGDIVEIETPGGKVTYEIREVQHIK